VPRTLYMMCRKHGEDNVYAADDGDTGRVHHFIPGYHLLLLQLASFI